MVSLIDVNKQPKVDSGVCVVNSKDETESIRLGRKESYLCR